MQPAYYAKIFESGAQQSCLHVLEVFEASFLFFFLFFQKMIFLCCIVPFSYWLANPFRSLRQVICALFAKRRCMHQSCFGVNISSAKIVYLNGELANQCRSFHFPNFLPYIFHACLVQTFHFDFNLFYIAFVKIVLENLRMLVFIRFERERTCPLCRALVKPADLRSFGDGSTSLFFQLFWVSWWWKIASEHDNIIVSNSHISLMGKFIVFYFLLSQLFLFIGSLPQGGCASRGGWLTCSYDRVIKVLGIYLLSPVEGIFQKVTADGWGIFLIK